MAAIIWPDADATEANHQFHDYTTTWTVTRPNPPRHYQTFQSGNPAGGYKPKTKNRRRAKLAKISRRKNRKC